MANPFDQFDQPEQTASATNPFDQFDASASAGKGGNPFDQFDGKEPLKASSKTSGASSIPGAESYDKAPPKYQEPSLEEKVKGLGEAGLTAATGTAAPFLGLLGGTVQSLSQASKGQLPDWKQNVENVAAATTYEPRTEAGQGYVEKVLAPLGENIQALGPMAPHFMVGEPVTGTKMLFGKGKKAVEPVATKLSALDDALAAKDVPHVEVRGTNESPVTAQMNPMERMAAELAPGAERDIQNQPAPVMANMAEDLTRPTSPETRAADTAMADRQTAMEQEMAQRVTLEQNAKLRAQQEAAPTTSPEMQAHAQALDQAKQAQAEAAQAAQQAKAQADAQAQGTAEKAASDQRAVEAQKVLDQRQQELELATKTQQTLDFNAAERARQEAAPGLPKQEEPLQTKDGRSYNITHEPSPTGDVLVARDERGNVIGRLDFARGNGTPSFPDSAVHPDWRRQGVGTALYNQAESMGAKFPEYNPEHGTRSGDAQAFWKNRSEVPFNQRTRGQGGGLKIDWEDGELVARKYGQEVGRLISNMTPEQNKMLQDRGMGEPAIVSSVKVDAAERGQGIGKQLYAAWDEAHGGNTMPSGQTTADAWRIWKSAYPEKVDAFVNQEAKRVASGSRNALSSITDPEIRRQVAERASEMPARMAIESYQPGQDPFKSQRGVIRVPGSAEPAVDKLKGIAAFRDFAKKLAPDRRTPEEFLAQEKDAPDINQNLGQKASNLVTKGSIYMQGRLNDNPLYKKVTERFREADGLAKAQQQQIVHDIYAPAIRELNPEQKTNVWGALQKMEASGKRLSETELTNLNFDKKEVNAIQMHQAVMDGMIPKINAALDAAGMSHITPQAAYIAAKMDGTFRKVMMDADNNVIGALGDTTTRGLAKQVAEFKKLHPDAVEGQQMSMSSKGRSGSMADVINFLSDKDPHFAEYLKQSAEAKANETLGFRGAKTHTMEKKGVLGMPGNRPWESAYSNAVDGFDSQIKYLNRMLEWAEKAKADAEVGPILDGMKGQMPNAYKLANDYRDFAVGRNPYQFAKVADALGDWFNQAGGGQLNNAFGNVASGTKKAVNIKLLAANPGFLFANVVQPLRNMPEMAAFLSSKGMPNTEMMGMASMGKVMAQKTLGKLDPIFQDAMKFAEDNHVYASDLIEQRGSSGKFGTGETALQKLDSARDAVEHILQTPASKIEAQTRQAFFLTVVDMLHENGIKKSDGLFDIAANLTDRGMNRYTPEEAPIGIKAMGSLGRYPYNLMSFKFNELSRFASYVRDARPTDLNSMKPLLTSLTMQVATAGLLGTLGYAEANEIVKLFSKLLDKPTSLTKILLDNGDKKIVGPVTVNDVAYGLGNRANVDMTNRMGVGAVLPDVSHPADLALPGISSLGQAASSAYDLAKSNDSDRAFNARKAAIDILPGGNLLEPHFFTKQGENGNYKALNKNKVEMSVERTPAEQRMKQFGFTSANESRAKTGLYENQQQDLWYQGKQTEAVDSIKKALYDKVSPKAGVDKFIKFGGNSANLDKTLEQAGYNQNVAAAIRDAISAAEGQDTGKMKRRFH